MLKMKLLIALKNWKLNVLYNYLYFTVLQMFCQFRCFIKNEAALI